MKKLGLECRLEEGRVEVSGMLLGVPQDSVLPKTTLFMKDVVRSTSVYTTYALFCERIMCSSHTNPEILDKCHLIHFSFLLLSARG